MWGQPLGSLPGLLLSHCLPGHTAAVTSQTRPPLGEQTGLDPAVASIYGLLGSLFKNTICWHLLDTFFKDTPLTHG